jgi:hypothetical protein
VVLIISDTDFDRYRNQVLTCDVISTDPGGPPLTVRLDESDPVAGWVVGPQIASTFKGYLAERLGEVHTNTHDAGGRGPTGRAAPSLITGWPRAGRDGGPVMAALRSLAKA